jgi:hypothetical protein
MALGGFSGRDATITAAQFAELVRDGKIRYVLTTGGMGGGGGGFPTFRTPTNGTLPGLQNGGTTQVPGTTRDGRNGGFNNSTAPRQDGTTQSSGFNGLILPGSQPGVSNNAVGASAVMSAVTSVCTPITDSNLPAQYQSGIYDCAGKADALAAR